MQLVDIFLARFAELGADGLFTVVGGGLDRIEAQGFPSSWGFLFLLARIRLTTEEGLAHHTTAVERETPNGQIEPIGADSPMMRLPPAPEIGPDGRVGLSFNVCLVNLFFPEAGVYKYRFKIDGQAIGVAELLVTGPAQGELSR
ncbi:MAG TPA: hypothetical protein VG013_01020 [Gemmataceae bacterium]|jgi:hypothetical protein|nr:hypothetical protein [Gemmataceae bacterium]